MLLGCCPLPLTSLRLIGSFEQTYWAKGTGFGYEGAAGTELDVNRLQEKRFSTILTLIREVLELVRWIVLHIFSFGRIRFVAVSSQLKPSPLPAEVPKTIENSVLLDLLDQFLNNDSITEMVCHWIKSLCATFVLFAFAGEQARFQCWIARLLSRSG